MEQCERRVFGCASRTGECGFVSSSFLSSLAPALKHGWLHYCICMRSDPSPQKNHWITTAVGVATMVDMEDDDTRTDGDDVDERAPCETASPAARDAASRRASSLVRAGTPEAPVPVCRKPGGGSGCSARRRSAQAARRRGSGSSSSASGRSKSSLRTVPSYKPAGSRSPDELTRPVVPSTSSPPALSAAATV